MCKLLKVFIVSGLKLTIWKKNRMDYMGATFSSVLKSCNLRSTKTCASIGLTNLIFTQILRKYLHVFPLNPSDNLLLHDVWKWGMLDSRTDRQSLYLIVILFFRNCCCMVCQTEFSPHSYRSAATTDGKRNNSYWMLKL